MTFERLAHGGGFEHGRLVKFAGDTPSRGEIDEDGVPLFQFALQSSWCEGLPFVRGRGGAGSDLRQFRSGEFLSDKIKTAAGEKQEHENNGHRPSAR